MWEIFDLTLSNSYPVSRKVVLRNNLQSTLLLSAVCQKRQILFICLFISLFIYVSKVKIVRGGTLGRLKVFSFSDVAQ